MVSCAAPADTGFMHDQLPTFDEFRTSHGDALRAQRDHLRDDASADDLLHDAGAARGWAEWPQAIGS
jgi:hypothetical protein